MRAGHIVARSLIAWVAFASVSCATPPCPEHAPNQAPQRQATDAFPPEACGRLIGLLVKCANEESFASGYLPSALRSVANILRAPGDKAAMCDEFQTRMKATFPDCEF